MKAIAALALLAVLGFTAASCGATKKIVVNIETTPPNLKVESITVGAPASRPITVVGARAMIENVGSGTTIKCKGWVGRGINVPPRGSTTIVRQVINVVGQPNAVQGHSPALKMQLRHQWNGSVTVICRPRR